MGEKRYAQQITQGPTMKADISISIKKENQICNEHNLLTNIDQIEWIATCLQSINSIEFSRNFWETFKLIKMQGANAFTTYKRLQLTKVDVVVPCSSNVSKNYESITARCIELNE
ncbi:hypothetical protein KFK09_026292 [Dendrobium nobile]|uniref:Uncharacterized protein n=1 Tax=Dendrobium nobile TaxID=94219 RepID=A0A8T3A6D1_DENNO|nr:hypothetical protein KFK09_026292 [Dendrobium nobile]